MSTDTTIPNSNKILKDFLLVGDTQEVYVIEFSSLFGKALTFAYEVINVYL